jgi:hypothetical protein
MSDDDKSQPFELPNNENENAPEPFTPPPPPPVEPSFAPAINEPIGTVPIQPKKGLQWWVILLIVLAVLCCCCVVVVVLFVAFAEQIFGPDFMQQLEEMNRLLWTTVA